MCCSIADNTTVTSVCLVGPPTCAVNYLVKYEVDLCNSRNDGHDDLFRIQIEVNNNHTPFYDCRWEFLNQNKGNKSCGLVPS